MTPQSSSDACIFGIKSLELSYLANQIFPKAQQIPLGVGLDVSLIASQLSSNVDWFVWHTLPTYKGMFPRTRDMLSKLLRERSVVSINEKVVDISKRNLQSVLAKSQLATTEASADGDADEELFLKSNLNYGGRAERVMPQEVRDYFGVALPHRSVPAYSDYKVVRRKDISPKAFQIADIFIERFIRNPDDILFRAFVTFDSVVLSKIVGGGVIKKTRFAVDREDQFLKLSDSTDGFQSASDAMTKSVMIELARFCPAFGLDLGAVDILPDEEGTPHIIDVNPTAWAGDNVGRAGLLDHLREGLLSRAPAEKR